MSWKTVRLGDVCELAYGKGLPSSERLIEGKIPAFGSNGIKYYSNKSYYDKPSIIIGRKGSAGELTKVDIPFWPLDVTYFVKFNESVVSRDYLYYCLKYKNLPSLADGVKPGINRSRVYNLLIILPPLEEQKRIVAKLDAVFGEIDKAIDVSKQKLEELHQLRSSILTQELKSETA